MSGYEKVKAWRANQPDIREKRAAEARAWRAAHPDVAKAIKQRYLENSAETRLPREAAKARMRRASNPELQKVRNERWQTKRSHERERVAGRARPPLCEICGELNIRIVFDHCHKQGHFRGWICDRCNRVLGLVKDSPTLLSSLSRYLTNGKANNSGTQETASQ